MNEKLKMSLGVGGPSIIMIFVILCLTTLGTLALVTAHADWKLTEKNSVFLTSYYKADCAAEAWLAQVDATLKDGNQPACTTFYAPVSPLQNLVVTIQIQDKSYQVVSQKLVTTNQWDYQKYQTQFSDLIVE